MSTEQQNPSLSSYRSTYDAFLSFRGADTRKGFTDHLYSALELAGIHTFRDDDEIERGANIEQELQTAIQESRVSVIVFSKDYASSSWCLNELGIIMERKRADGHMVIPVFYDVEPSDVRKQTGSFAESFTRHEKRFKDEIDKVEEWRRALRDVVDLGGMVLGDRYESQFIQDVVEVIGNKLDYLTNRRLRGTRTIKGLMLNFPPTESSPVLNEVGFETKAFTEMLDLELLLLDNVKLSGSYEDFPKNLIWLSWRGFSLKSIPANFCMENLVVLDLRKSSLQHVWKGTKNLTRLKILDLSHSHGLRTTSDLSGFPNLEKLILKDCINLVDVDESIGNLGKLVFLNLQDCKSLMKLPKRMNTLRSLEELILSGCSKLVLHDNATVIHIHAISRDMSKPRLLSTLSWTPIRSWWMWAWPGKTLQSTSFSLASLPRCLGSLNLSCCNLSEVPNDLCTLPSLKHLDLSDNPFVCLPQNMKNLITLKTLLLDVCWNLEMLPELPARLEVLKAMNCKSLKRITTVPYRTPRLRVAFYGCAQLVEVESVLNIKTLRSGDIEMTRYMSLFNLKSIGSTDVEMYNYLTGVTRKAPVQVVYECGIYSIFLHASKIPDGFDFTTHGKMLSFIAPSHPNLKIQGLNVGVWGFFISIEVSNQTKARKWLFCPTIVGVPSEKEDVLWLSHFRFGNNELEDGDHVSVSVPFNDEHEVELGIQLVYEQERPPSSQNNVVAGDVSLSASASASASEYQMETGNYFLGIRCPRP
ncbi:hypothetical protein DVH24_019051 [Malus domestica]|uniref:TIR domain-containing protein n=1 Tax=Malus domestica TaxID=3750 RepID=A0A498I4Y1_MALDO|nr:hypothetical protein DVH24_019051 [Malus domestica]